MEDGEWRDKEMTAKRYEFSLCGNKNALKLTQWCLHTFLNIIKPLNYTLSMGELCDL